MSRPANFRAGASSSRPRSADTCVSCGTPVHDQQDRVDSTIPMHSNYQDCASGLSEPKPRRRKKNSKPKSLYEAEGTYDGWGPRRP